MAVCYAAYKVAVYAAHKMFDDDGLVPKWVDSELQWRNKLTERLSEQQKACVTHGDMLGGMAKLVSDQVAIGTAARDSAMQAASQAAAGNLSLAHIDKVLADRGQILQATNGDVDKLKKAALRACELCRFVAEKECPNSAKAVDGHLTEIERIIGGA
jgi:hypothetical protein